jgi:ubiquitin C-terminal hydrolase
VQELVFGNCTDPLAFANSPRLFPWALKAAVESGVSFTPETAIAAFTALDRGAIDEISLRLACFAFSRLARECRCPPALWQTILLDCQARPLRDAASVMVTSELPEVAFLPLLALAAQRQYRNSSRELFTTATRLHLPPELFIPTYMDLVQYETTCYCDPDETFIGLVRLIPMTDELVALTLARLFSAPTCRTPAIPFVHTRESWEAALSSLQTEIALHHLHEFAQSIRGVPSPGVQLSGDFTYSGRNGITNMGSTCYVSALFQVLNVLEHYSLKLISLPTGNLEPFVQQVRDVLARLRFIRGSTISAHLLAETIPNFNACVQEDAGEFLTKLVNQVDEKLDREVANDITDHLRGKLTTHIRAGDSDFTSTPEDFFYLSLRTKNMSYIGDAFVAYFEEEFMEGGYNGLAPAFRHSEVTQWPDYLVVQLQRWDFAFETGSHPKLTHQFGFPLAISTSQIQRGDSSDIHYHLVGIVVHEGTTDEGHYVSIVQSLDKEWYLCNDARVEYFDINQLPQWAFGNSDSSIAEDEVSTAYLLFYARIGMDDVKITIPRDLEEEINRENAVNWPRTVFFSEFFVRHVHKLVTDYPRDHIATELGLIVFFRVAIVDEQCLRDWSDLLINRVLITKEKCQLFFEFIETNIRTDLPSIVGLSDIAGAGVRAVVSHGIAQLAELSRPLLIVLDCMNLNNPRRHALPVVFALITDACRVLSVDWAGESELLTVMFEWLSVGVARETTRSTAKAYAHAFNLVMGVLNDIVQAHGVTQVVADMLIPEKLNKLVAVSKKSDNFAQLLAAAHSVRPDLFSDLSEATTLQKSTLTQIVPSAPAPDADDAPEVEFDSFWPNIGILLFVPSQSLRQRCASVILKIVRRCDPTTHPLEGDSVCIFLADLSLDVLPHLRDGQEEQCTEFLQIAQKLSLMVPTLLGVHLQVFLQGFTMVEQKQNRLALLQVIYNLIVAQPALKNTITPEQLQYIFGVNLGAPIAVRLINLYPEYANGSVLVGACMEYYFDEEFDDEWTILVRLISQGLVPGAMTIPRTGYDFNKLTCANLLWNIFEHRRPELSQYMLNVIGKARPWGLFQQSETIAKSVSFLEDYCQEKLDELITQLSESEKEKADNRGASSQRSVKSPPL